MLLRRTRLISSLAIVALVTLAACSNSTTPESETIDFATPQATATVAPEPTATSAPSPPEATSPEPTDAPTLEPAPTVQAEMTVEEEILFAYEQGVQAWLEAGRIPDPNYPGLLQWMTEDGSLYENAIAANNELIEFGWHFEGDVDSNLEILEITGGTALIQDCQLDRSGAHNDSGDLVRPGFANHVLIQGRLRLTEDGWKTHEWLSDFEQCDP